ncbi:MAG: putative Ig domain-containing protein [Gammaproteobacteria bacterium]|nr:putative Ig domain-containing protein [Gammaproteobacteria bacterium]
MDENDEGAMVAMVTTENASEVTADNDYFEVADGNLKLKDGMSLDFENVEGGMIELTLTASGDGESATAMVTVTVNDVNEDPSIDVRDGEEVPGHPGVISNLTIAENATRDDAPPLALIEVMDPDTADADMLTGDAGVAATSVSDDRFAVILDPENGLWLHLAEGASLDHEAGAEVTVTVTYTDSAGNTASQDVTVMVTDVNEPPVVVGEVGNVAAEAGKALSHEIDLMSIFNDPDGGDSIDSWTLSGGPDWLELVTRHDDGSMTGILQGTPPTTGAGSAAEHMVTITATDSGGETASISFYVVVDDGNDAPTGINLLSDTGQSVLEVEVDENDASGVILGQVTVDDIDSPQHPYGQHLIKVDNDRFEIRTDDEGRKWLALKAGESLNRERESGEVLVTLTAIDRNGEENPKDEQNEKGKYKGHSSDPVTFAVVINDVNDAPSAGSIGNWWVTVDEDLDEDEVDAGDWLSFSLETQVDGDRFPAFSDQDLNAGDELTYALSGPAWLQIDEETGEITNKEDMLPTRGVYRVTVTATDEDGQSASKSFQLHVALSKAADDGTLTDDNDEPEIDQTSSRVYRELSGEQRVATFRVSDRDQDIPDHQFALKTVEITAITNPDNANDRNNVTLQDHDGDDPDGDGLIDSGANAGRPATPMRLWTNDDGDPATGSSGYAAAFELSDPIKSSSAWTFHIEAVDTNPSPYRDTTHLLDYEDVDELDFTIRASDGVTTITEDDEVQVRISERNEPPYAPPNDASESIVLNADLTVEQEATNVKRLYINLEDLWSDDDDRSNQLEFGASSNVSWIDILYGPAEWGGIADGPDGNAATAADNITWGGTTDEDGNTIDVAIIGADGTNLADDTAPDRDEMVVIVEIDRTERNNEGDRGGFTLTAEDREGATGERTYNAQITDENLPAEGNAVSISGSSREGSTLTAHFNDNRDPDLGGDAEPALVLYTWYRVDPDATSGDPTGTPTIISQSTSNTYTPGQLDVGRYIGVVVNYYEVAPTDQLAGNALAAAATLINLVGDDTTDPDTPADPKADITSRVVSNTPDKGAANITILANSDALTVANTDLRIRDGDYSTATNQFGTVADPDNDDATATPMVSFEVSNNGRGGWTAVDDDDVTYDDTNNLTSLSLDDGEGKFYRAVVSYNADTGDDSATERVYSDPVQVSDVRDADATAPLPTADIIGSTNPGGTLSVDVNANVEVQWQIQTGGKWIDIAGATGSLSLTQAHAGATVRAVVSYLSRDADNPGVTAVTTVAPAAEIGGTRSSIRPVKVDDHEIEASVGGSGHGFFNTAILSPAGHNATIEETVRLTSLFQDADTPSFRLTFAAATSQTDTNLGTNSGSGTNYVYEHAGGVLVFDARSGKITYLSDEYRGHDGTATDGAGNTITLEVTAGDASGNSANNTGGSANIVLRINVAPTDITFRENDATDKTNDANNTAITEVSFRTAYGATMLPEITITENVEHTGREVLAVLDVQDENAVRNKFGTHEVTVSGDNRFVIRKTGGDDSKRDPDSDGSTWELHTVRGATFDYETDDQDGNPRNGIQILLTFEATDGGGLSTPTPNSPAWLFEGLPAAWLHQPIQLLVTIDNDESDDVPRPNRNTETPGLKDDSDDDDDNDQTDGGDDDTDGGGPPPPPGASLGGIIEDFIDNMDQGEQDLLEDFLLTIDDGLDIV